MRSGRDEHDDVLGPDDAVEHLGDGRQHRLARLRPRHVADRDRDPRHPSGTRSRSGGPATGRSRAARTAAISSATAGRCAGRTTVASSGTSISQALGAVGEGHAAGPARRPSRHHPATVPEASRRARSRPRPSSPSSRKTRRLAERPDAAGRARRDDVARLQGERPRAVRDERGHAVDQLGRSTRPGGPRRSPGSARAARPGPGSRRR